MMVPTTDLKNKRTEKEMKKTITFTKVSFHFSSSMRYIGHYNSFSAISLMVKALK